MKKILIFLIISLLFLSGCSVKKVKELTDSEKFANEFQVSEKNPFKYANYNDVINTTNSTGIIFMADPDNEGCIKAAKIITKIANKNNIEEIQYYNPDKIKNKKRYKKLVKYFKEYLIKNEEEEYTLNTPILVSIKDGNIIGYSNYFSIENQLSEDKLTKKKLKIIEKEYLDILNYNKCSNCN